MTDYISKKGLNFFHNIWQKKFYILLIWFVMFGTYFYFDGPFKNTPIKTFLIIGGIFTFLSLVNMKLYNKIFSIILFTGLVFCVYTPNMDSPDENFHYSRALYISDGHLYLPSSVEEMKVSSDISEVEGEFKKPLLQTELEDKQVSDKKVVYSNLGNTNGYSFVSYLPQTLGIILARILHLSVFASIFLGRFFNLLVFALLVRLAVKKSGDKQLFFSLLAIIPINIYIAASFNQDAFANGLIFLVIGLFLSYFENDKVSNRDILSYSLLCILIAFSKLPYVLLICLLAFLPKEKLNKKQYLLIAGSILMVALTSVIWLKVTSGINATVVHPNPAVNPMKKIIFTLHHFSDFTRMMIKEVVNFIPFKLQSLFTFGWLTYDAKAFMWFYLIFISVTLVVLPNGKPLKTFAKFGVVLVSMGIVFGILMTAYLMWGEVADISIKGIQGRYFAGIFILLGCITNFSRRLFWNQNRTEPLEYNQNEVEYTFSYIATLFILVSIIATISQYY